MRTVNYNTNSAEARSRRRRAMSALDRLAANPTEAVEPTPDGNLFFDQEQHNAAYDRGHAIPHLDLGQLDGDYE